MDDLAFPDAITPACPPTTATVIDQRSRVQGPTRPSAPPPPWPLAAIGGRPLAHGAHGCTTVMHMVPAAPPTVTPMDAAPGFQVAINLASRGALCSPCEILPTNEAQVITRSAPLSPSPWPVRVR